MGRGSLGLEKGGGWLPASCWATPARLQRGPAGTHSRGGGSPIQGRRSAKNGVDWMLAINRGGVLRDLEAKRVCQDSGKKQIKEQMTETGEIRGFFKVGVRS